MTYYTQFWKVLNPDGTEVNLIFVKKKDATAWIAEQQDPDVYTIKKYSMY